MLNFHNNVPTAKLNVVMIVLTKSLNTLIYGGEQLEGVKVNLQAIWTFRSVKAV